MYLWEFGPVCVAFVTVLQFSTSHGKVLNEVESTTEIVAEAKADYTKMSLDSLEDYLILGGIVLGTFGMFIIIVLCKVCSRAEYPEERVERNGEPPQLFSLQTIDGNSSNSQQQPYLHGTENNPREDDLPPEYPTGEINEGNNLPIYTISSSANQSIMADDGLPPPTYYDVTQLSSSIPQVHSSGQRSTSGQLASSSS